MSYPPRTGSTAAIKWTVALVGIAAITGIGYFMVKDEVKTPKLPPLLQSATVQPNVATSEPSKAVEKPVYEDPVSAPEPEPLPDLNQSDTFVMAALQGLSIDGLVELILPEEILRKTVRAVDALEGGRVVTDYRPIVSPQGSFIADTLQVKVAAGELGSTEEVEQYRISAKNYARYTVYVRVIAALNTDAAVNTYKRFYPLLNKAYQELGLGKGNFHSVLVRAIDHLLAAPDADASMSLVRPKVYYQFADPVLEKLPETHKLMMRMGLDNEQQLKQSLRGIRLKLIQK